MYHDSIEKMMKEKGISTGDRVSVNKKGNTYEGALMPRIETGDRSCIVIKLDNGYNIGIDCQGAKISKVSSRERQKVAAAGRRTAPRKGKPHVSIVSTGGTITSRVDYKTGGVTSLTDPEELVKHIPELGDIASVSVSSPFTIMSESMTHEHWQKLSAEVSRHLRKSEGVVVTHGTDTLHFTSAALSFMLPGLGKPVILTASQRSTDRGSSDGPMNLACSARAALSDMSAVGICMHGGMNDDFCILSRGTKVRKMHTSRRDAFRPINDIPLARVWNDGRIEKLQDIPPRTGKVPRPDTAFEPKVALVKTYPGCSPDIIDYYSRKGYRGIVVEVMGIGQLPTSGRNSWIRTLRKATESGMLIFGAATTLYGRLNPNVYAEGRMTKDAGVVHLGDMLPETAYVKLGWVLGHTKSADKAREMMLRNYAGEISERLHPDSFLY